MALETARHRPGHLFEGHRVGRIQELRVAMGNSAPHWATAMACSTDFVGEETAGGRLHEHHRLKTRFVPLHANRIDGASDEKDYLSRPVLHAEEDTWVDTYFRHDLSWDPGSDRCLDDVAVDNTLVVVLRIQEEEVPIQARGDIPLVGLARSGRTGPEEDRESDRGHVPIRLHAGRAAHRKVIDESHRRAAAEHQVPYG